MIYNTLYNFKLVAEKYSTEISTEKTKIMAFCGTEPVPSKICLNTKIFERVNEFNCLGYKLSFVGELDLPGKISKYSKTMGIINNVLKPSLVQKHTHIRIYKTLARPMLSYGSEAWTTRKSDKSRITACEIKFKHRTAGYTNWDLKRCQKNLKWSQYWTTFVDTKTTGKSMSRG
jgi:hypothetical protein